MTIREYPFPLLCLNRALIQLQHLGILESVKEQKRNRVFVARKVIDVLDRPTIPEMF